MVNKKEFHASKQTIALHLVDTNKIVVSDKFKFSDNGPKYFIGYSHDDHVFTEVCSVYCITSNGYVKYFDNGGKNMSFKIENKIVYLKYTETWKKIKKSLNTRFHSQPLHDDKYIKTEVKTFSGMIITLFSDNEIPKERNHYIYIAAIFIDSVLKVDNKKYPQVYVEQCKYKIKIKSR